MYTTQRGFGAGLSCVAIALVAASAGCETKFQSAPMMGAGSGVIGGGSGGFMAVPSATPPANGGGTGGMNGSAATPAGSSGMVVMTPVAGSSAAPAGGSGGDVPVAGTGAPTTEAGASGGSAAGMGGTMTPPPPEMEACPTTALPPGNSNETIMIGSARRTYILHVPPNYKGDKPVPLVIDWHPLFTNASYESTASGYAAKADQEGFIVAFPDGIDAAWNVGPCCTSSRDVDDLGLARGMVAAIEQRACIDKKRVYSVGFSMGGGMTLFLACNAADIFASFAPAAFDLLEENEEPCHPPRPVAVLAFRGTADPIVPYTGGPSNPPNGLPITIHFLGAKGTSDKLAMLDGCTGSPMMAANGCNMYTQCNDGVEVGLCTKTGGSHETGDPNVAWPFLMAHPMP